MTTDRFDQKDLATNPYGKCKTCGIEIATQEVSSTHMRESRHTIQVLNQSREDRIESSVYFDIADGLDRIYEELYRLVEDGDVTAEELTRAIQSGPSLDDGWDDYLREVAS